MIAAILTDLVEANLAAGAGVLLVLALRNLVRPTFGARAAYALWLAPLVAAAAVLLPHPQIVTPLIPMVLSAETMVASAADELVAQAPIAGRRAGVDFMTLVFAVWLTGALAAGSLVLWRQARFIAAMGRLTPSETPGVFRAASPDVGPAVVGAFRPRIVAPADFETRFAPDERRLILAHEETHLRGGDASVNALASALLCLCWFNPLAHIGVRSLRIDQELACDAAVIDHFPEARRAYAELLLNTQIATQPLPLGCHWSARAEHPLKERIAMLKSPLPELTMRAMGLALAGLLSLGAGGLAWAAQPGSSEPERLAAEADGVRHPSYTCDPAGEARDDGCTIVGTSAWLALPWDGRAGFPVFFSPSGEASKPDEARPMPPRRPLSPAPVARRRPLAEPKAALTKVSFDPPKAATALTVAESPNWSRRPGIEELVQVYPAEAVKGGVEGDVLLHCQVTTTGRLADCSVLRETPGGAGFGLAALKLTDLFEAREQTPDGGPKRGGEIRIPVRFRLPNAPAPSAN